MKMRTCLAVILAVGLLVGAFAADGYAACELTVKVVEVDSYSTGGHNVYCVDLYQVLPGYYYIGYINATDENIINAAQAAATSGRIARVRTNYGSCPTAGTSRFIGTVDRFIIIK